MPHYLDPEAMFWSKVDRGEPEECWLWVPQPRRRYGQFFNQQAHRWIYSHLHGAIPEGMLIRHSCDVPRCVNPSHLLVGTQVDNMRDMDERGRRRITPTRKLTWDAVFEIRERHAAGGVSKVDLAREYGVTDTNIRHIVSGKTWNLPVA